MRGGGKLENPCLAPFELWIELLGGENVIKRRKAVFVLTEMRINCIEI
jgi:hypothetical protein